MEESPPKLYSISNEVWSQAANLMIGHVLWFQLAK